MGKKTIGSILAVFLFLAVPVYAQEGPSADDIVSKMQTELNLTQDQVNSIKPIIEQNMAKRQELRQSMEQGSDKSAMHSQMEQLKQNENQQLSQILNSDQMNKWSSMQSQMHKGGHHKRHGTEDSSNGEQ